ncbi:probable ATP-dependent RNA helicase DHX34 [Culicoides brevitarsis]|uniref:probable ATP-dependent RNA helicase DHX34 n=1 Tax=Culicoides brevitarsis TaxID=469753 RepID=UPI00307C9504
MSDRHKKHKKHHKRSRSRSPSSRRDKKYDNYNRYRDGESSSRSKNHRDESPSREETNLLEFSFLNYKYELNRILLGNYYRESLVDDVDDFWLFVRKYENLLKKSGQCLLPIPKDPEKSSSEDIPSTYDKVHSISLYFTTPFDELFARLPQSERRHHLTELKIKQFLGILTHYMDFRQKEKFNKLKKLRKAQRNLPVAAHREEIVAAVRSKQVVILAGDTGCGKSTQVPQYLVQGGFDKIALTQPRRLACIALSKRVAHEMLCEYDNVVGYQIRFERNKNVKTKILFITEGLLLRQLSVEENLEQYSVLILDEVHERNLFGDFLLGICKCLLRARPDLKLVLMSATINLKLFSDYFAEEQAHVIEVPGRLYPIKLHYMPVFKDVGSKRSSRIDPQPYISIMSLIDQKYPKEEKGDLLIFLSGLNEITTVEEAAKAYAEKNKNWIILPLHSQLAIAEQDKVFDYCPDGVRKCIIATNIAETSITIDGIRFVADSGKVKEMSYDAQCKMQRLKEFWISKASAEQRKGRAGRTGPGVCYRLYSEKDYEELEPFTTAEIQKVPLESVLLQMISMGLPNARLFPFIEPPPSENMENAILALKQIDALTADEKLTPLGKALARIPVDITIGKMLMVGCVFRQLQPVLTLCAALSIQSPFTTRAYRDKECEEARKSLESDHGDPITLLNAYREWLELKQDYFQHKTRENSKNWCRKRGIEEQRFYEITKLRRQFEDLLKDCGLIEMMEKKELSSAERAIRNGEMRQLKQLKRAHKMEAPRKKKLLRHDAFEVDRNEEEEDDRGTLDIRDVEMRMSHDASRMQNLLSGSTACDYRDLMTIKVILTSGLYPQVAIADEFNHLKSVNEQFFHTKTKPYTCLHPMSYFGNNSQILQLTADEIEEKTESFQSKMPLSAKHQLLCYVTLLETTKPYLMSTFRMPAAQTLLLFSHVIDANLTCSRVICDTWLLLEFPSPDSGLILLSKALKVRATWSKLLSEKLEIVENTSLDNETKKKEGNLLEKLEFELEQDLVTYMNSEICYTIKRLLPGDLKTLYMGPGNSVTDLLEMLSPNPFSDSFSCIENTTKGGVYVTENVTIGCIIDTSWSLQMMSESNSQAWECPICHNEYFVAGIEKLKHSKECKKMQEEMQANEDKKIKNDGEGTSKAQICDNCKQPLPKTPIEILRHKKKCAPKDENIE